MPNQTMVYSCSAPEQEYTMVWFGIFLYLLISSLKIRFCEQSVFAKSPLVVKKSFFLWSIGPHCLWDLLLAPKSTVFVWFEPVAPTCANKGYIYVKEDIFPVWGVYVTCLCNLVLTYRVMLKISLNTICNSAYSN